MAYTVTPYLTFDRQCEAAFTLYADVLGGKVGMLHRYRGSPMEGDVPKQQLDDVMHAQIDLPGAGMLFGSDAAGPEPYRGASGFQLTLGFADIDEARRTFDALSAGGKVTMPFAPTFWAAGFGMLVDRFGIPWCVNCDQPQ